MWAYIYRNKIFDISDKIFGCTGISPAFIKSAWVPETALIFENQISENEKSLVDEFMLTREMSFHRLDEVTSQTSGSIGGSFQTKYFTQEYNTSGRLSAEKEYATKISGSYSGLRKETLYTYSALGALLTKTINIYNGSGTIEDSKEYEYITQTGLTKTTIKQEGT